MSRPKKCKSCGKEFNPSRPLQQVCGFRCAVKLQKAKEKAKEKAKKEKMRENVLSRLDYVKILQRLINKIVRDIDFGSLCICCKQQFDKLDAGHFYPVSTHPHIRFHLFNLWGQSRYCNSYKHGNLHQYTSSLFEMNLLEFIMDEATQWRDLELSKEDLKRAIKAAKTIKIEPKQRTIEQRIELRKLINEQIGIYA